MGLRRSLLCAVVLAGVCAAPAHAADPEFSAALAPEEIVFGGERPSARLTVRTGSEAASFRVTVDVTGRGYDDGGSVLGLGCNEARLEGSGSVGPTACVVPSPVPRCHKTHFPTSHGTYGGQVSFEVSVPAGTESTVVVPVDHAHTAPWPDSRYEVRFAVGGGTLAAAREIRTPAKAPAGRTGVRLSLSTSPGGGEMCRPSEVPNGPVTVSGRSDPALAGEAVILRFATAADPEPRDLARVRIGADGTFELRNWRPAPGHHEVAAVYTARRSDRADDFSAPVAFVMRAPDPPPPPPSPPVVEVVAPAPAFATLLTRRVRVRPGGLLRLRLFCPGEAVCTGPLRLRAHGRTLAARQVVVAPGARRAVRVRLSRWGRRVLRRRGRLRVMGRVGSAPAVPVVLVRR